MYVRFPLSLLNVVLANNCAMQLVRMHGQFGDMLSNVAAMVAGSLGMLPSALMGARGQPPCDY